MMVTPRASRLLPTGTVTFLFTDVEGSTRLWETQREAMAAALTRHDALLRHCIEAQGGHVFKTGGDAFYATFATAASAVEAALAAQRALCAERWPEQAKIHARMALHTGAAEIRDGDYFGAPLSHVARLLAAGHGGQTLLSEITHDLCRDRLPAETTLKSLGEHGLKDLARRETVFQLCHPELPQAFPPLKTLRAPLDESVPSIAVLPFVNMSSDEENEYFSDGLVEELTNLLIKLEGLHVPLRTSAFAFKGKSEDIRLIWGVATRRAHRAPGGSVRKAGNCFRTSAQLLEMSSDGHHLWSETYDRQLEDVFAVQDDIAQSVVKELRSALLGHKAAALANATVKEEVQAASRGRGENVEAYRLYLQGRFFEDRFTREGSTKALEYYRRALEIDPGYGLACAGVARVHCDQAGRSWLPIAEGFSKAREAAQRALQIDPDLAEAHAAMGAIRIFYDWDWQGADESLCRAMELAPGNARILRSAAIVARSLGRLEDAIELLRRAAALDPLGAPVHRTLAATCHAAGLLDEAEAAATKALEINSHDAGSRFWLGLTLLARGRLDEAQAAFEHAEDDQLRLLGLTLVHHASGRDADSQTALQALVEKDPDGSAYQIAQGYAGRGESDLCFEWLDRAYHQHDAGLAWVKLDPLLASVRGDPRWQPFLQRMKLAD